MVPGSQRGKPVKVFYVLPITFKLSSDATDIKALQTTSTIQNAEFIGGDEALLKYQQSVTAKIKKTKEEKDKKLVIKVSFIIAETEALQMQL